MFITSKGYGISTRVLPVIVCGLFLYVVNIQAFKVTVDSTKAAVSGKNYKFLDTLLWAINNKTLTPATSGEDTVQFTDTVQRTYPWNADLQQSSGSIRFIGNPTDPMKFPIIQHNTGGCYNYFNSTNFAAERLVFTGSESFVTGVDSPQKQYFKDCVIRDFTSSAISFLKVNGNYGQKTSFINCLVTNNKFSTSFVENATWGDIASVVQFINCTFHHNTIVFSCVANAPLTSTTIKNCIFSGNDTVYSGTPDLKSRITYSVVPDGSFSGAGNVITSDPYYTVSTGKTNPSDWRPTDSSVARELGEAAGAPETDISGALRYDVSGKRDAGCWDILDGVRIVTQPVPVTGIVGDTVIFTVEVTGLIPLTYQWKKIGGSSNPIATTDTCRFVATLSDDSTRYYCIIANEINTVTSDTVLLRAFQKPAITDQPDTTTVFTGDSAMFSVTATGGDLSYSWSRNGTVITNANSPNYIVRNVSTADSGALFVCKVVNQIDSVYSRTALLRVISPEINIVAASPDTMLTEGGELQLHVTVSGKPPVTYEWYMVGDPALLSSSEFYNKTNVTVSDSGAYRCIVTNVQSIDSVTINAIIMRSDKPNITDQSGPLITVKTGAEVNLSVMATGKSPLTYTWYRGSYVSATSVASGMSYTIASASGEYSGNYFCVVENEFGSDTCDIITLTVSSSLFFNPLELSCTFIDPTHAMITVANFRELPVLPEAPYVDSVGLWFDPLTMPSMLSINDDNVIKLSLGRMRTDEGDVFDTVVLLPKYDEECSDMHFIVAPIWREPDTIVSSVSSTQYKKLYMCATTTLVNKLVLTVEYTAVSDSIDLHIANLSSINRDTLQSLNIEYTLGTRLSTKETIDSDSLPAGDIYNRTYHDIRFTESEETLTVSVVWRGILGNYSSKVIRKLVVGKPRPPNNARLYCDSTTTTTAGLRWEFEGAKDFDSIRILWGMQSFSAYTNINDEGIRFRTFGPSVTQALIDSLTPDRQYHIGLQVIKESVASLITANSIVICTTKTSPLITIINSINLYEASFIADSNLFRLAWRIDTTRSGPTDSLETGIVWEIGAPPNIIDKKNRGEILVISTTKTDNEYSIDMKDSLQFMAVYHFALLLRRKGSSSWTSATDSSCGTVETGEPLWQQVTYFEDGDSVVTAFNGTVTLQKTGEGEVFVIDTLLVFLPETIDSGFKVVSDFGIDFKNDFPSDPIVIGLAYDLARVGELPVNQIRMYQYDPTAQTWSVLNGCTIDLLMQQVYVTLRPNSFKNPFILLIDTLPPTVTIISDTAAAVAPSLAIRDTVKITDNIVNCSAKLVYWGQRGQGGRHIFVAQCTSKESIVYPVVPSDSFSIDRGIKTELVVSDGVSDMVYDISRRVNRSTSDPMSLPAMKWAPVMTTAKLSNINIEASLAALSRANSWAYDSLYFRIFRWIDTSSTLNKRYTAGLYNWVEYQPDHSTLFDMVPGRVIWVKSRETKNITLGKGVTVSMKEPWEIPLKANDWNDIALPYNIDIRIGDLFTASASQGAIKDSVLIYGWERDEQTQNIVPTQTYIPAMPEYDSMRTILKFAAKEDGYASYTVLNTTSRDLVLSIPPIPAAFSPFASTSVVAAAKKHSMHEPWSIVVTARTAEGGLPPVLCAGNNVSGRRVYPVVPSFSRQRLLLRDPDQASFCGSIIQNDTGQNGFSFTLLFENRADVATQFSYTVTSVTGLPRQWNAVLHDPLTGKRDRTGNIPLSVPVGAEAGVYKMLLVGDSTYIASWNTAFTTGLSLRGIYPNPCRGPLIIRFTLPLLDIRQVDLIIYDQLGRRVRTGTFGHNVLTFGENILRWEFDGQRRLSAGTYIVQLSVQAANGKKIGSLRKRLLYLP